jgi:hypothetical protein
MMTILIAVLLFNALHIVGFYYATGEGMILSFFQNIKGKISMPLYDCPTCMASIHSTFYFFPFAAIYGWQWMIGWPLYICALAGASTIIYRIAERLSGDELIEPDKLPDKSYQYTIPTTNTDPVQTNGFPQSF